MVRTHPLNMLFPSNFTRLCLSLDMVSCACTSSTSSVYCSHSTLLDGFLCGSGRPACWVSTHIGSSQRQEIQYNMSNTMLMNFPFVEPLSKRHVSQRRHTFLINESALKNNEWITSSHAKQGCRHKSYYQWQRKIAWRCTMR